MTWKYRNGIVTEIPEGYVGFVYIITNMKDGRIYVGKKIFEHRVKSRISKREIKSTKTRKRVKITLKDSGWQNYQSSCVPLQEDIKLIGAEWFNFMILEFCIDKRELSYREVWYQFHYNVLEVPSYNGNILGRFFKQKQ